MSSIPNITITMDGQFAGKGYLRNGIIEACGAQFCDDIDRSIEVYEQIEAAIARGEESIVANIDGDRHVIAWTIWHDDRDDDTLVLITTSELLRRLGIDASMRAELTASHGPIPDRLWSQDQLAALTRME